MPRTLQAGDSHNLLSGRTVGDGGHPQFATKAELSSLIVASSPTFVPASTFGAVPNTGADMTAAVTSAFASTPLGAVLFFEPGTYIFSAPLACDRAINLLGYGAVFDWTTFAPALGTTFFTFGQSVGGANHRGLLVSGIKFKRTYAAWSDVWSPQYIGLKVDSVIECAFDHVTVEGFDQGIRMVGNNTGAGLSGGCYLNIFTHVLTFNCRYHVTAEAVGALDFVNENRFSEWHCQHGSTLGTAAEIRDSRDVDLTGGTGVEYLRIKNGAAAGNQPNNWDFNRCDFESAGSRAMKRKIRCEGGFIKFDHCRYEGHRAWTVPALGGGGGDGAAVFDGVTVVPKATFVGGSTYYLTANAEYTTITVSAGINVVMDGFTMQYSVSLTNSGIIDQGYDITIGRSDQAAAIFQEIVFFYGYDLRIIYPSNGSIQFLSTSPGLNNRNHIYAETGIWIPGGVGTIHPVMKLANLTNNASTLTIATGTTNADRMRLYAQHPTSGLATIEFLNSLGTSVLNRLALISTTLTIEGAGKAGTDFSALTSTIRNDTTVQNVGQLRSDGTTENLIIEALRRGVGGFIRAHGGALVAGPPVTDTETLAVQNVSSSKVNGLTILDAAGSVACAIRATAFTDDYVTARGYTDFRIWRPNVLAFNRAAAETTPAYHGFYLFNSGLGLHIPIVFRKGLWINGEEEDADTRISGANITDLVRVDASTDRVGIATATPTQLLDVAGVAQINQLIVNEAAANLDSRFEGATEPNLLYVRAVNDAVGIRIAPSAALDVNGDINMRAAVYVAINGAGDADYTVGLTEHVIIFTDPLTAARSVFLPDALDQRRVLTIKDASGTASPATPIVLDAPGAQTIDGATTYSITTARGSVTVVSDLTSWHVI